MTEKVSQFEYKRADISAAAVAIKAAAEKVKSAKSGAELKAIRDGIQKLLADVSTAYCISEIRYTLNVKDEFYLAEKDYYDENMPNVSAASVEFNKALLSSPYIDELKTLINPLIIDKARDGVRVMDERIIPERVEENKLVTEYDNLMASLTFEWRGERLTLAQMQKYTKDPDRSVRKAAFTVIGKTLESVSDKLDAYMDKLVAVRTRMAQKMGFADYSEMGDMAIGHFGYGRKEIAVFRESVLREAVPMITRLKGKLCKKLGIDKVHIYDNDNYIKGGNIDPEGTSEQLFAAAQSMYDDMKPELGEFFKQMCDAEAIDYRARENKLGGGYAEIIQNYGQPFIFANFNGTMDDVGVLTHEFGHAYAFKRAYDNDIDLDLGVGGMETAETHSMGMEALCNKYNGKLYGGREKEATYQQIFDAVNFLPYGVIVDYFQELIYKNYGMTPDERKALWIKLENEFRPYVDMSDVPYINIGGRWQYQKHIYEVPFYYIDYCLSTCLALQFGELAAVDYADALNRYLGLVEAGGTKTIDVLAQEAGLKSPFDGSALKELCAAVEKHIEDLQ